MELYYLEKEGKLDKSKETKCIYCGKIFIKKGSKKYCSKECTRLARNKSRRKSPKSSPKISTNTTMSNISKPSKVKYNGIIIKIEKEDKGYYWKAYRNDKFILESVEYFTEYNLCLKDAKLAF